MRFYDREKELGILQTNWEQTVEQGLDKTAVVAEIKRQRRKFSPTELAKKVVTLNKELSDYTITQRGLSMEDM